MPSNATATAGGFFYLRDKPQFILQGEPEGYDPLRRVYLYGEEGESVANTAFVSFRVRSLSLNSLLYVSSASFGGEYEWERGTPVA